MNIKKYNKKVVCIILEVLYKWVLIARLWNENSCNIMGQMDELQCLVIKTFHYNEKKWKM